MKERQQSTATYPLLFLLVQSSDHITALTGASPTVTLSKNGAAFGAPAGAVTEIGSGWYQVAGNATDSNTLGPLVLHATAASGDPADQLYTIVPWNPFDAVRLGLTALPNAAAAAAGGLPTVGTGTGQINVAGGIADANTKQWLGQAVTATPANTPIVAANVKRSGTAQAGSATTITLDAGASAVNGAYVGCIVGVGDDARVITAYNGTTKVATVDRAWTTNPTGASIFAVHSLEAPALDASLRVQEVVLTDTATSVTNGVIVSTNNDKTGYSLAVTPPTATQITTAIWQDPLVSADFGTAGSIGALLKADVDAAISSRLAASAYTAPPTTGQIASAVMGDVTDTVGADVVAIKAKTDLIATNSADSPNAVTAQGTVATNLDAKVSTRSAPATPQTIDLTSAVPTTNTAQTIGDALNAARAQGFGKWSLSGTTLTLYAADGTTVVRTFTLDSATSPTQRT